MDEHKLKAAAALSSIIWSAVLTVLKLIVGLMTGSLGIISEALHSGLDLLAAGLTYVAVRISARPADEDHHYGHGKIENLSALVATLLLLLTSAWVMKEALTRLQNPDTLHIEINIWAFLVIIISIVVDVNRSAMLYRVAKQTKSAALEADAAHFLSDIWSSSAVLLGIACVACLPYASPDGYLYWWLQRADVLASLFVAVIILKLCWGLGSKAIQDIMDKTDIQRVKQIRSLMSERMPAYPLEKLKLREVGSESFIELIIRVPKNLHIDTAHEIAEAIEELLIRELGKAQCMVHMHPDEYCGNSPQDIIRRLALAHRFGVHGLIIMPHEKGPIIFADLELPAEASLDSWDTPTRAFQSEVARALGAQHVYVHIEPDTRQLPSAPELPEDIAKWEERIRESLQEFGIPSPSAIHCHRLDVEAQEANATKSDKEEVPAVHCLTSVFIPKTFGLNIAESHAQLKEIEKHLMHALPSCGRIIICYDDSSKRLNSSI